MKLYELVDLLRKVSFSQPNIGDCFVGSVTELNERQDINYPAIVITQDTHYIDETSDTEEFTFYIFAVDRLLSDGSNKVQIHSWANEVLIDIIKQLEDININIYNKSTIETFTQKFDSICAGAFIKATFTVDIDDCENDRYKLVTSVNGMVGDVKIEVEGASKEWVEEKLALDYYNRDEVQNRLDEKTDKTEFNETINEVNDKINSNTSKINDVDNSLNEVISDLSQYKQDQHTIDESQNDSIDNLSTELEEVKEDVNKKQDAFNYIEEADNLLNIYPPFLLLGSGEVDSSINNSCDYFSIITSKYSDLIFNDYEFHVSTGTGRYKNTLKWENGKLTTGVYTFLTDYEADKRYISEIKTINGESLLGSGNIEIKGGDGKVKDVKVNNVSVLDAEGVANIDLSNYVNNNTFNQYTEETDAILDELGTEISQKQNTLKHYTEDDNNVTIETNNVSISGDNFTFNDSDVLTEANTITINNTSLKGEINLELATSDELQTTNERIDELELYKFPNVTLFGEPNIQNGQLSNFSSLNYAQFPFLVDFHQQAFEINMCFTTGNQVATQENIFDSIDGLAFAVRGGHFVVAMSSDGQTWNMGEHIGTINVNTNTTYYVKFSWNKLQYKLDVSTDRTNYTNDFTVTDTRSLYAKQIVIGKSTDNRYIFSGSINLNYCSLSIMGQQVWQGMDDVGIATRLATDLSNIDEAGVNKIKDIVSTREWYGTQAEFEAITEYQEGINYYIYDTNTPITTNYMMEDMPVYSPEEFDEVVATMETFDTPLDKNITEIEVQDDKAIS